MKYITLIEKNSECPNIGTIVVNENLMNSFKEAIEAHFDTELTKEIPEADILRCLNYQPIELTITLDNFGEDTDYTIEISQTWLYQ